MDDNLCQILPFLLMSYPWTKRLRVQAIQATAGMVQSIQPWWRIVRILPISGRGLGVVQWEVLYPNHMTI